MTSKEHSKSKQPSAAKAIEPSFPEDQESAEGLAARFFALRNKARRLKRESEECQEEANELQAKYPFLGNLLGELKKAPRQKRAPPESDSSSSQPPKKLRREKPVKKVSFTTPGNTMSQKEINQEGGEVKKKSAGQQGRLETMDTGH